MHYTGIDGLPGGGIISVGHGLVSPDLDSPVGRPCRPQPSTWLMRPKWVGGGATPPGASRQAIFFLGDHQSSFHRPYDRLPGHHRCSSNNQFSSPAAMQALRLRGGPPPIPLCDRACRDLPATSLTTARARAIASTELAVNMALNDSLTGHCQTGPGLHDRLDHETSGDDTAQAWCCRLDLNRFKDVNDLAAMVSEQRARNPGRTHGGSAGAGRIRGANRRRRVRGYPAILRPGEARGFPGAAGGALSEIDQNPGLRDRSGSSFFGVRGSSRQCPDAGKSVITTPHPWTNRRSADPAHQVAYLTTTVKWMTIVPATTAASPLICAWPSRTINSKVHLTRCRPR